MTALRLSEREQHRGFCTQHSEEAKHESTSITGRGVAALPGRPDIGPEDNEEAI